VRRYALQRQDYRLVDGVLFKAGQIAPQKQDSLGYMRCGKQYVHRIVACLTLGDIPRGTYVDHINRDRADNSPGNLRLVTPAENSFNNAGHFDSRSGVRGVSYHAQHKGKKWRARLRHNKKEVFLGYHETKEQAAAAVAEYLICPLT
jgi:hypothetical protein